MFCRSWNDIDYKRLSFNTTFFYKNPAFNSLRIPQQFWRGDLPTFKTALLQLVINEKKRLSIQKNRTTPNRRALPRVTWTVVFPFFSFLHLTSWLTNNLNMGHVTWRNYSMINRQIACFDLTRTMKTCIWANLIIKQCLHSNCFFYIKYHIKL